MQGKKSKIFSLLILPFFLASCKLNDDKLYGSFGDLPSEAPHQDSSPYCEQGSRLLNTPYANSSETGVDGLTEATAFTICTPTQMNAIGANSGDWGKFFKLESDIDMQSLNGTQYNIIGNTTTEFTGEFDGNGNILTNFSYTNSGTNYVGLFGVLGSGGVISNVGIKNASTYGGVYSSILAGLQISGSTIENVFVQGTVRGSSNVGGIVGQGGGFVQNSLSVTNAISSGSSSAALVGYLLGTGVIKNSLAMGSVVSGGAGVGLIAGFHSGSIENSIAIGNVEGVAAGNTVSFIAGWDSGGTVTNSFFDSSLSCINNGIGDCSDNLTGVNLDSSTGIDGSVQPTYFYTANPPYDSWDFALETANGSNDYWELAGSTMLPQLAAFSSAPLTDYCWTGYRYFNGPFANSGEAGIDGSSELKAFTLCSSDQLNQIGTNSTNWDKYYTVEGDINMAHLTGTEYNIIGDNTTEYSGIFNGDGNSIYNLTYSNATQNFVGLIGVLEGGSAELKNLKLVNVSISGNNLMGGAVGDINVGGEVHQVYVSGNVTGIGVNQQNIGGVVGSTNGVVSNVVSEVIVTATAGNYHGGIIGTNGSALDASFFSGSVVSAGVAGGLTGSCTNFITNSFSVGDVQGSNGTNAVGLVSGVACGIFTNVYYDSSATCTNLSGTCSNHASTNAIDASVQTTYFYDRTNLPLLNWDFTTIWQENSSTYPSLKP